MSKESLEREAALNRLLQVTKEQERLGRDVARLEQEAQALKVRVLGDGVVEIQPRADPLAGTGAVKVNIAGALKAWRQREGLTPYAASKRVFGHSNGDTWKALEKGAVPRGKTPEKLRRAGVL